MTHISSLSSSYGQLSLCLLSSWIFTYVFFFLPSAIHIYFILFLFLSLFSHSFYSLGLFSFLSIPSTCCCCCCYPILLFTYFFPFPSFSDNFLFLLFSQSFFFLLFLQSFSIPLYSHLFTLLSSLNSSPLLLLLLLSGYRQLTKLQLSSIYFSIDWFVFTHTRPPPPHPLSFTSDTTTNALWLSSCPPRHHTHTSRPARHSHDLLAP